MTIDEIRELIHLVSETGVAELEVQRGENRVRIRQAPAQSNQSFGIETTASALPPTAANPTPTPAIQPKQEAAAKEESSLLYVKSPIVGTFYESPSPETPPFVRIGERVTAGKVLCIIESMKLMNEIEADISGIVESCIVKNGQPVEYGEALFGIRPV